MEHALTSDNAQYTESQLLAGTAAGDENAFARLYTVYAEKLFPFLVRLTGDNAAGEDIVQDTFLAVWLNRDQLPEIKDFKAWVYRIAANRASTWMSKHRLIRRTEEKVAILATGDTTMREVLYNDVSRLVNQAVAELPAQRRNIYQLYRHGSLSYNEIAGRLNISPSTARTAVSLALAYIRDRLKEAGLPVILIFFISR